MVRNLQLGLLALLVILIVASYVVPTIFGGLRWALYVYLIADLAWILGWQVYLRSISVPTLGSKERREGSPSGELRRLARILDRADRGMRYSQMRVFYRVRNAFIGKVASVRGLTEEEAKTLLDDPDQLRELINDPIITNFLSVVSEEAAWRSEESSSSDRRPAVKFPKGESTTSTLGRVIERLEAWP